MTDRQNPLGWLPVVVAVVVLLMSGCSLGAGKETGAMTLEQAKREVWQTEDELMALVPEAAITQRWPRSTTSKVLFECGGPGQYYWPSSAELGIDPATDLAVLFRSIHDKWVKKAGWIVTWKDQGNNGRYYLDLLREDGLHVAIMNLENNSILHIGSFSPCFVLSNYDPNKSY